MEGDDGKSWIRRTKFSQTVCHRLDKSWLPSMPFSSNSSNRNVMESDTSGGVPSSDWWKVHSFPMTKHESNEKSDESTDEARHLVSETEKPTSFSCPETERRKQMGRSNSPLTSVISNFKKSTSIASGEIKSFGLNRKESSPPRSKSTRSRTFSSKKSKTKQRALSPPPTPTSSDTFKEARSVSKRFSTPARSRKDKDMGLVVNFFSKESNNLWVSSVPISSTRSVLSHLSPPRIPDKARGRKETPWAKYFEHGEGKVNSVHEHEEWKIDLSELYIGVRFASGAHSRLYRGEYKSQPVAVKIITLPEDDDEDNDGAMKTQLDKQFNGEVTLLSLLDHKNVIKLVGASRSPPVLCVVTEYLPGGSLRDFLNKLENKVLPIPKLIKIALDIAKGMEYIHSQGMIHRDLKPENVLFDEHLCAKIADFGIACEAAYGEALAEDPGTYRFMAPEMIKHKSYGRKIDVYSFGLIVWEMLSGKIPYDDMTPYQAAFAVVHKNLRPVIPSDCPPSLRALVEQCWTRIPDKRPEFKQIVKILKQFESALARNGTLDSVSSPIFQDNKKSSPNSNQRHKTGAYIQSMPRLL